MRRTTLNTVKRCLVHLLVAFLTGVFVTALLEIGLWMALFHFFPAESDDSGFGGVGVIALLVIAACIGAPLFSIVTFFLLRKRVTKKGN